MGKRSIVSEWAPEDNGNRERAWWTAPMVSVCENMEWFQMYFVQSAAAIVLLFPERKF